MLLKQSVFLKFFLAIFTLYFVYQLVIIGDYSHPHYFGGPINMEIRGLMWANFFRFANPVFILGLLATTIAAVIQFVQSHSRKPLSTANIHDSVLAFSSAKTNFIWSVLLMVLAFFEVYYFTLPFTYVR